MYKRLITILLALVCIFTLTADAYSHSKTEHDKYISCILFGSEHYKDSVSETSKKDIEVLENAVALCLDQFNGNYEDELKALRKLHIHGVPSKIADIDFSCNRHHRRYTHKGWNHSYESEEGGDKAHFETRKTILLQTVNKVFGFQRFAGKWRFVFEKNFGYDEQCEAFAKFLYYAHILTDIPESGMSEGYKDMIKLAVENPSESNPDIYYELLDILPQIFASQTADPAYTGLITDIELQAKEARTFAKNTPDKEIESDYSKYKEYAEYANDLIKKLESKIPSLMKREPFFKRVFYAEIVYAEAP